MQFFTLLGCDSEIVINRVARCCRGGCLCERGTVEFRLVDRTTSTTLFPSFRVIIIAGDPNLRFVHPIRPYKATPYKCRSRSSSPP
jgi:hypothetical protein